MLWVHEDGNSGYKKCVNPVHTTNCCPKAEETVVFWIFEKCQNSPVVICPV